ncbi:MAG: hypothetical protein LBH95_01930 [Oscillospiraceae bacterium]|jgi:hypothetical protein|nr:hypothetical protein [Oscillospiraceae bacterium]
MWNRRHWLTVRVRVRRESKRGVFVWAPPLSVHTARGAVLSCDGLLGLIPGSAGRAARGGADALQKALAVLQEEGLDADVRVTKADEKVSVRVHMV